MAAPINIDCRPLHEIADESPAFAADLGSRGFDAYVVLTSARASAVCYQRKQDGRLVFVTGSRPLFDRYGAFWTVAP